MNRVRRIACILCTAVLLFTGCASDTSVDMRKTYRLQGIELFEAGQYEEAEEAFQSALSLSDGRLTEMDFDISLYRALAFRERGMFAEANAVYDSMLDIRKEARTYYAKGCNLLAWDNLNEAYRCFEEALKAGDAEDRHDISEQIYQALVNAGYEEAAYTFSSGARPETETLSASEEKNKSGLYHMAQGEYEEAIKDFEEGLALQEEGIRQALMRNRIAAYEYAGNFGAAAELMEVYAARFPEDAEAARELIFLRTR